MLGIAQAASRASFFSRQALTLPESVTAVPSTPTLIGSLPPRLGSF
jgi:hypothetical protein